MNYVPQETQLLEQVQRRDTEMRRGLEPFAFRYPLIEGNGKLRPISGLFRTKDLILDIQMLRVLLIILVVLSVLMGPSGRQV